MNEPIFSCRTVTIKHDGMVIDTENQQSLQLERDGNDKQGTFVVIYYLLDIPELTNKQKMLAFEYLDEQELERYHRLSRKPQQAMFLAARLVCKELLSQYLGCDARDIRFVYSKNGKPSLKNNSLLHFSLSHTNKNLLLAISNATVGTDIESLQKIRKLAHIPDQYLNSKVGSHITGAEQNHQKELAVRYWTTLEAIVKLQDSSVFKVRPTLPLQKNEVCFPNTVSVLGYRSSQQRLAFNLFSTTVSEHQCAVFDYRELTLRHKQ